jgi:hypothetical protein
MSTGKNKLLSPHQLGAVARLFSVLSEPSRLALLQALQAGPLSVTELIEECGMKQANVNASATACPSATKSPTR